MLIRFGNQIRLTRRVAGQLEQLTGIRPDVRTIEDLKRYFREQWERYQGGGESHQLIRTDLLAKAKALLSDLPIAVERTDRRLVSRAAN